MRRIIAKALFLAALAATGHAGMASSPGKDQFEVKDAVEWRRFVNLHGQWRTAAPGEVLFSPDGSLFAVQLNWGNTRTNTMEDELLVYSVAEIISLAQRGLPGPPQPLATLKHSATVERGQISQVQWVDGNELGFVAEASNGKTQAFTFDVATGLTHQLTNHESDVIAFAANENGIVYLARVNEIRPAAQPLESKQLSQLLAPRSWPWRDLFPLVEAFSKDADGGATNRLPIQPFRIRPHRMGVWLSPDADWAIIAAPATNAPLHWARYRVPYYDFFGYLPDRRSDDPTSLDLQFRTRLIQFDLKSGSVRPLLDAPSGQVFGDREMIFWLNSGRSIIIANTLLPLNENFGPQYPAEQGPAIAEIDLVSGAIKPIAMLPKLSRQAGCNGMRFREFSWDARRQLLRMLESNPNCEGSKAYESVTYVRSAAGWERKPVRSNNLGGLLTVKVNEDQNHRPVLVALPNGRMSEIGILDPNLTADRFAFGESRTYEWKDAHGRTWRGGLLLPEHQPNNSVPLIIQTHGFDDREFLVEGPDNSASAFSARAFVAAGFAVLQMGDNAAADSDPENELQAYAEGVKAAVDDLVSRGIADQKAVGMIGWSRTGLYTLAVMANYPNLLAAATIADAATGGYLAYLLAANQPADMKAQAWPLFKFPNKVTGAPDWKIQHPIYSLTRAQTPLRIETMGPESLIHWWEPYALMRYACRPVDLIYFHDGSHSLVKPAEKLASQEGNLDWFRFWLMRKEDRSEAKVPQYERWGKLAKQAATPVKRDACQAVAG